LSFQRVFPLRRFSWMYRRAITLHQSGQSTLYKIVLMSGTDEGYPAPEQNFHSLLQRKREGRWRKTKYRASSSATKYWPVSMQCIVLVYVMANRCQCLSVTSDEFTMKICFPTLVGKFVQTADFWWTILRCFYSYLSRWRHVKRFACLAGGFESVSLFCFLLSRQTQAQPSRSHAC